jgi:flagellar biosynthetic protein FlhB
MPDQPASERSEEATPHRLQKARQEGRLAQSQDVPTALVLFALLLVLTLTGPGILEWFIDQVKQGVTFRYEGPIQPDTWVGMMSEKAKAVFLLLAPFLAAGVAVSIFSAAIVSGWAISPKALKLDFGRINPVKGVKNLISFKSLVKLLTSLLKLAVLGTIIWTYLQDKAPYCLSLIYNSPGQTVVALADLMGGLLLRIVIGLTAIALVDLIYQRKRYKKDLRMTKQEVREEMKQYEINPHIKGRIRSIQREMARKRMLADVPSADAVITNPTHFAVAIKYDPGAMDAPIVLAKGADILCQRIKEIAAENDVPIVERPPLARTLYATCEIGQPIPETLFVAVAEILAMIYRMKKSKNPS